MCLILFRYIYTWKLLHARPKGQNSYAKQGYLWVARYIYVHVKFTAPNLKDSGVFGFPDTQNAMVQHIKIYNLYILWESITLIFRDYNIYNPYRP